MGSGAVRRALAELAAHIRNALDSIPPSSKDNDPNVETTAPVHHETRPNTDAIERESDRRKPIPEMPIVVVDQMHRGNFTTISQAIKEADPGSRILVHSGIYDEGLILDKALEIVGDGNLGDVTVRAEGKDAISFKAASGRVSNLVLQQTGGGEFSGVDIGQGVLELEGCDISGSFHVGVAIHGKAFAKLRGNKIHDGKASGIYVYENGQGLIEDNDIFGNANSGIAIKEAGNPTVRGNRINKNVYKAVYVHDKGAGIIEDNDLRDNKDAWYISDDSKDLVKRSGYQE